VAAGSEEQRRAEIQLDEDHKQRQSLLGNIAEAISQQLVSRVAVLDSSG